MSGGSLPTYRAYGIAEVRSRCIAAVDNIHQSERTPRRWCRTSRPSVRASAVMLVALMAVDGDARLEAQFSSSRCETGGWIDVAPHGGQDGARTARRPCGARFLHRLSLGGHLSGISIQCSSTSRGSAARQIGFRSRKSSSGTYSLTAPAAQGVGSCPSAPNGISAVRAGAPSPPRRGVPRPPEPRRYLRRCSPLPRDAGVAQCPSAASAASHRRRSASSSPSGEPCFSGLHSGACLRHGPSRRRSGERPPQERPSQAKRAASAPRQS